MICVNDRVRYSTKYLRQIGDFSADSAGRVGTVVSIFDFGNKIPAIVRVLWDGESESKGVLECKLSRVRTNRTT